MKEPSWCYIENLVPQCGQKRSRVKEQRLCDRFLQGFTMVDGLPQGCILAPALNGTIEYRSDDVTEI